MSRVRLISWKPEEGNSIASGIRAGGFTVDYEDVPPATIARSLRESPPDAVVIDLSRLPSNGRNIAVDFRGNEKTRQIPLLFVGGEPAKVEVVREQLPDAAYCVLKGLIPALRKCIKEAPSNPIVPQQPMERYATRSTAQKLGIAAEFKVAVMNAPRDYALAVGALPADVTYSEESWEGCAVTLWFVEEPETLLASFPRMRRAAGKSKLWIAWPKKSAGRVTLLNENQIRDMAIEAGLVDYKVCSINEKWSGLCFAPKALR